MGASVFFWALVKRWWPQVAVFVGLFGLVVAVVWIKGQRDDARADRDAARSELEKAHADLAVVRVDAAAKERASVERVSENAAVAAHMEELSNAVQSVPDTQPDAVRVALGCQRLRAANRGAPETALPVVCRSGDGTQARPAP